MQVTQTKKTYFLDVDKEIIQFCETPGRFFFPSSSLFRCNTLAATKITNSRLIYILYL